MFLKIFSLALFLLFTTAASAQIAQLELRSYKKVTGGSFCPKSFTPEYQRFENNRGVLIAGQFFLLKDHSESEASGYSTDVGCSFIQESKIASEAASTTLTRRNYLSCPKEVRDDDTYTAIIRKNEIEFSLATAGTATDICRYR